MANLFNQVRAVVRKIPRGKVATYGQVARMVGTKDARKVGYALHGNQDKTVPCHRVIRSDGTLAENFSLGGAAEQQKLLEEDGIEFEVPLRVNLGRYQWEES